ncbi:uncharacterized protein (DUF488 family) [Nocardioides daedukensis]|uniref:Uncharacterized protein (DUF488 family) n=1 Tax=Nocardioides daedukensis TaxID=634462 RepID=A0A7Y9RYR9_9ACTN|nr:DUF488 domain-containing protein [Nocardioides daedukensis]NYG57227.1 uncharacterized protein (DUF488 family) [Nocardioides daedukensis]
MLTFGHGRLDRDQLAALLGDADVELVVDIRRFPGSRNNPAAAAGQVEALLEENGIGYRHDPRLGGRRRLNKDEDAATLDPWWRVAAFRAYADWTRTEEFGEGLAELIGDDRERRTAIMCSEAVWWRCHRRVVSDVAVVAHGLTVEHLMHDGRLLEHPVSEGVRRRPDGLLVWDRAADDA